MDSPAANASRHMAPDWDSIMGLEQSVSFAKDPPAWPTVRELLERHGCRFETRMIDGALSFPDEEPGPSWSELRLATGGRMITLRRDANRITFVIWGNADAELLQARNLLMWAYADAGQGTITTEVGTLTAAEFRQANHLPSEKSP